MARYLVRRLLAALPILVGLSVVLFLGLRMLPGDPASAILGQHATPQAAAQVRAELGLDEPLPIQYVSYVAGLLRGDLGFSYVNNQPVATEFATRFPATIELAAAAMLFAVLVGIPMGRTAARRPHSPLDAAISVGSILGIAVPVFVLGLGLQYVFGVLVPILPTTGRLDSRLALQIPFVSGFMLIDTLLAGRADATVDAVRHLILPAITLGSIPLAYIARVTRSSVLDASNSDHVRTALAKGLSQRRISGRHVMRNAWLPVVTIIGLQFGSLLGGAVITETVFGWNGVGRFAVTAILNHDYLVVQSTILLFAITFLIVNLITDLSSARIDPRIALAG